MNLAEIKERVLERERERDKLLEEHLKKKQLFENIEAETAKLREERLKKE